MSNPPGRLQDKVAIVTGAASGMGIAIAERFVKEGARVVCTDIDSNKGQVNVSKLGDNVRFIQHDVASEAGWNEVVRLAEGFFGRLDILINNAGLYSLGSVEDISIDDWGRTIDVNLRGPFLGCRSAIGLMKRCGGGAIINIASVASFKPIAEAVAYNASKAGVDLMTKSIALHCGAKGYGIRVNSINPGTIRTPMVQKLLSETADSEALMEHMAQMHCIGRIGEPSEIAAMATYLASDEAAFITGAAFTVDGGMAIK